MNKKKLTLIGVSSVFVIAIFVITLSLALFKSDDNNEIYQAKVEEKIENQVGGFLTLMLETEASSGEYRESTSGTWPGDDYEFNGTLSACQNGGELSWDSNTNTVNLLTNTSDACYVYFDKKVTLASVCNPDENLSECIINYYNATGDMDNGLYYHTSSLANSAGDNSYRYAGANPNNYVCFGSDAATCPEDNLYRIIGVFDGEVKLIKSTSYGNYVWESDFSGQGNTWNATTKPDIYTTLNTTYLNSLGNTWSSKIATHSYEVGGMTYQNGYESNAQTAYNYEVGANKAGYCESMKIGLMYVSDYYYGATNTYWTYPGFSSSGASYDYSAATGSNWMYMGLTEWTISRGLGPFNVFIVNLSGAVTDGGYVHDSFAVRPVFYLNSNVQYSSGTGTSSDPVRIVI